MLVLGVTLMRVSEKKIMIGGVEKFDRNSINSSK